jgi:hypothetical protein
MGSAWAAGAGVWSNGSRPLSRAPVNPESGRGFYHDFSGEQEDHVIEDVIA